MADFRFVPPFFIAFFSDFDGCVVCVAFCRVYVSSTVPAILEGVAEKKSKLKKI